MSVHVSAKTRDKIGKLMNTALHPTSDENSALNGFSLARKIAAQEGVSLADVLGAKATPSSIRVSPDTADYVAKLGKLRTELDAKDRELREAQRQLAKADLAIASAEAEANEKIADLASKLAARDAEIAALKVQVDAVTVVSNLIKAGATSLAAPAAPKAKGKGKAQPIKAPKDVVATNLKVCPRHWRALGLYKAQTGRSLQDLVHEALTDFADKHAMTP